MNVRSILWLLFAFFLCEAQSQGYKIKVKINGYPNDTLLLGYHYGDKQYIKDTARKTTDGFIFTGDTSLEQGMYLIVTKPDHDYVQILVDDKQNFSMETDFENLNTRLTFKGSRVNSDFVQYLEFISSHRTEADSIGELISFAKDSLIIHQYKQRIQEIDEAVKQQQLKVIQSNEKSLLSLLIKWSKDVEIPAFEGATKQEKEQKSFDYYKTHYFDYVDFSDDRSVRLPLFAQKVDRYIQKLTVQIPDSINVALGYVIDKAKPGSETFRYLLSNYLNSYANSQYVGMDGVYVFLVEKYYNTGKADWIEKEHLAKISQDAKSLKPLLIDKIAPNISLFKLDGSPIALHDVKSPYTILLFWAPDCGHCKLAMPSVVSFYDKYKAKGVEIFAVCSKLGAEEKTCKETIDSLKMEKWINVTDPMHLSRYKIVYDIKSTPQIYILDHEKKIITKKIAAEKIGEVMDKILNFKEIEQN